MLFGTVVKISFELDRRKEMELYATRELQRYRLEEVLGQLKDFQEQPDLLNAKRLANVWNNFVSTINAFLHLNQLNISPSAWESFQTSLQNNDAYKLSSYLDVLVANNKTEPLTLINSVAITKACDHFSKARWDIRDHGSGQIYDINVFLEIYGEFIYSVSKILDQL